MFCSGCGYDFSDARGVFCPGCGTKTTATTAEEIKNSKAEEIITEITEPRKSIIIEAPIAEATIETKSETKTEIPEEHVSNKAQENTKRIAVKPDVKKKYLAVISVAVIAVAVILFFNMGNGDNTPDNASLVTSELSPAPAHGTASAAPSAPASGTEPASQLRPTRGVYIKRGEAFIALTHEATRVPGGGQGIGMMLHNIQKTTQALEPGDYLVYFGDVSPQIRMLTSAGFYVAPAENISFSKDSRRTFIEPTWGRGTRFTYINGLTLAQNYSQLTHYFYQTFRAVGGGGSYLLIGNSGQRFTLGRWEGTQWHEVILTANREAFYYERLTPSIARTHEGYFILEFQHPPPEHVLSISWDGNLPQSRIFRMLHIP